MEFNETGLPADPILYQAFMDLEAEQKDNGEEGEQLKKLALRSAQILQETTDMAPERLVLPLILCATPTDSISRVRRSYGENLYRLVDEAYKHNLTSNAYLASANPDIKLMTAAMAVAAFEQFSEDAQKTREDLERQREEAMAKAEETQNENAEEGFKFKTSMLIPLPSRFYDYLAKAAFDTDSQDHRLEYLYFEKLSTFKVEVQEHVRFLDSLGLYLRINGKSPAEESPPRPDFEDTELPDIQKIHVAYDLVSNDPRIEDKAFSMALNVAKILSQHADVSPTAVGLALMDISYEELSPLDQMFLRERVDWDLLDPLTHFSVQNPMGAEDLQALPIEFRQVMAGFFIARMQLLTQQSQKFFDQMQGMTEDVSPELGKIVDANLHNIQKARQAAYMVQRAIGNILESPSLENELKTETQNYDQHVTGIFARFTPPKGQLPGPQPKPDSDEFKT